MKKLINLVKPILVFGIASIVVTACHSTIAAKYDLSVKINPSDVITSFPVELNNGDLTVMESGFKIRVSLYAFDASGFFIEKKTDYLQNYDAISNMSFNLEEGKYILLATTDIVKYDGSNVSMEYWNFGEAQKLSDLKITDNGKIGFSGAKILGVSTKEVTITDSAVETNIDVKPAGSLALLVFNNIHYYSNIKTLEVETSKLGDFLSFENTGKYSISYKWPDSGHYFRIESIDVEDYSKTNYVYSYIYLLPGDKYEFKARYATTEDKAGYLTNNSETVSIGKGEEYLIWVDCMDEESGKPLFFVDVFEKTKSSFKFVQGTCRISDSKHLMLKNVSE